MFLCGPAIAASQACAIEEGTEAICIVDAYGKQAIRFDCPTALEATWGALTENAVPVVVILADGVRCDTLMDEADYRIDPTTSWYRCEDGSTLVSSDSPSDTSEQGDTWTVRRTSGIDAEMETVAVQEAVFAGR